MKIRYTSPTELDVSASISKLNEIAELIETMDQDQSIEIQATDISAPSPYDSCLERIKVMVSSGPPCISVKNSYVEIQCGVEYLESFASYFRFNNDSSTGDHHHFDYFPGNDYVDPKSLPLVVAVDKSKKQLTSTWTLR